MRFGRGQTLQLDAIPAPRSRDGLDLLMKVYDPVGALVGEDDDSGGALNPRVTVTSEAGGLYRIDVDVLGEGGAFTLLARESVYLPEVVTGLTLSDGRAEHTVSFSAEDDTLFSFTGRRGEVYAITLVGLDLDTEERSDPMLEVFQGSGTAGASLFTDDDGAGNLDSRVIADLPETGTYTVRASSLSGSGRARLAVAKMTVRPAAVGNLGYDAPATVEFNASSPFVTDRSERRLSPYALFRLPATPVPAAIADRDEVIVLRAESEGLDPWLEVGIQTPFGFTPVLSNDDADGLNARLTLDPEVLAGAGAEWWDELRIRVTAPPNSTGEVRVTAARSSGP